MNIIQQLEKIRESKGFSQERMAYKVGVTLATYNRWIKKKHAPSRIGMILINQFVKQNRGLVKIAIVVLFASVLGGCATMPPYAPDEPRPVYNVYDNRWEITK